MKSIDPQLALWDTATGKQQWSITTDLDEFTSIAFSPDGMTIASGHFFGGLVLWNAQSGAFLRKLDGHIAGVNAVAFSKDGLLASAGKDGSIRLWDVVTGQEVQKFIGHEDGALTIAFEPDQRHLVSGGMDRLIRRWDVVSGGDPETIGKHAQAVDSVAVSPAGLVASASSSRSIKIWNSPGEERHLIEELKSQNWSIAISPDSRVLAASIGYKIQRWETATATLLAELRGHHANVAGVSYSNRQLASVAEDGSVVLWNAQSGGRERTLVGLRSRGTCVAFSPDGALVLAGSAGKNRGRR